MTHYTMLERKNCWSNCGRKRGWAGRCNYCGPNGYCCHMDGRGSCTKEMSDVLKESFIYIFSNIKLIILVLTFRKLFIYNMNLLHHDF